MANKNTKTRNILRYKAVVASTGRPPQHMPRTAGKRGKVACLTFKDHKRIGE